MRRTDVGKMAQTAAFFRVEGVLTRKGVISFSAYVAANAQGFAERLIKLGQIALAAPAYNLLGQSDRTTANRVAYLALRDMGEDRIVVLAEEYLENILTDDILKGGVDLLEGARERGHEIVLVGDGLDYVMEPLAKRLKGADQVVCNHLEFRDGLATGKLVDPVIGGFGGGRRIIRDAVDRGIDLEKSLAYASHGPDLLLLDAVGNPCAVNPDFTLRRVAREADWPILQYDV